MTKMNTGKIPSASATRWSSPMHTQSSPTKTPSAPDTLYPDKLISKKSKAKKPSDKSSDKSSDRPSASVIERAYPHLPIVAVPRLPESVVAEATGAASTGATSTGAATSEAANKEASARSSDAGEPSAGATADPTDTVVIPDSPEDSSPQQAKE